MQGFPQPDVLYMLQELEALVCNKQSSSLPCLVQYRVPSFCSTQGCGDVYELGLPASSLL